MTDWRRWASCLDEEPELWFPDTGDLATTRLAKEICADCIVADDCLQWALNHPDETRFGVWGGLTADERAGIWRTKTRTLQDPKVKPNVRSGRFQDRTSETITAATISLSQFPKQPRPTNCRDCGRVLRPGHARADEHPGTVKHHGRGLCAACYGTRRRIWDRQKKAATW